METLCGSDSWLHFLIDYQTGMKGKIAPAVALSTASLVSVATTGVWQNEPKDLGGGGGGEHFEVEIEVF